MKTILILGLIFLCSASAHAEFRIIGVRVTRDTNSKVHVSIASDEAKEKRNDITIDEAATILREAEGWGSSVIVGIFAHDAPLQDYLPLLKAISDNAWLELAFVEGPKANFINDKLKKSIEQRTGSNAP